MAQHDNARPAESRQKKEPTVADLHRINTNLQHQHNHDMRVLFRQDQENQSLRAQIKTTTSRAQLAERKAERLERENSQLRKARRDEQLPMLESGGSSDRFMFGLIVGTAITSALGLIGVATGVLL